LQPLEELFVANENGITVYVATVAASTSGRGAGGAPSLR